MDTERYAKHSSESPMQLQLGLHIVAGTRTAREPANRETVLTGKQVNRWIQPPTPTAHEMITDNTSSAVATTSGYTQRAFAVVQESKAKRRCVPVASKYLASDRRSESVSLNTTTSRHHSPRSTVCCIILFRSSFPLFPFVV